MFVSTSIVRWTADGVREVADDVVEEEPLEVRIRGRAVSVAMRTPGDDEELAVGFLLAEGLIHAREDVEKVEHCGRNAFGNVIDVSLAPTVAVDFDKLTRHVFAGSSCGLCGKATIESIHGRFAPLDAPDEPWIAASQIAAMSDALRRAQATFDRTGGIHAAGLFDEAGRLVVLREDVGRHNAVDKVLGYALLNGLLPLNRRVLFLSGRSSFEILQKALAGGVPIVAGVSAPSSLAIEFARANRQTLIGFVRDRRMNAYSHPARVRFE